MPPPVHGASMMGAYIHDSKVINEAFDCHYLNLTLAKDINDIGKGGIRKLIVYLKKTDTNSKNRKENKVAIMLFDSQYQRWGFLQRFLYPIPAKMFGTENHNTFS